LCFHYANGFDNVERVYFFYSNPKKQTQIIKSIGWMLILGDYRFQDILTNFKKMHMQGYRRPLLREHSSVRRWKNVMAFIISRSLECAVSNAGKTEGTSSHFEEQMLVGDAFREH
jgi:hypothetical protein